VADKCARGRIVSVLEGGYDLQGLARSAGAHIKRLMGTS
jgi:acetoin utilization deacetylase AcuC-like enzyme